MRGIGRNGVRVAAAGLVLTAAGGCTFLAVAAGAAAGTAAYAYVKGEGKRALGEPMETVRDAVVGALGDLALPVLHKDMDATSSKIRSTTSDGRDIVVVLTREGEKVTMMSVRVGVFGDRTLTRTIFDKTEDRLKLM